MKENTLLKISITGLWVLLILSMIFIDNKINHIQEIIQQSPERDFVVGQSKNEKAQKRNFLTLLNFICDTKNGNFMTYRTITLSDGGYFIEDIPPTCFVEEEYYEWSFFERSFVNETIEKRKL